MTRETLYDAITQVRDGLVMEAMETKPAKQRVHWLRFGSIAAAVALVVGLGAGVMNGTIRLPFGGNQSGSGHGGGSVFMDYAGPVFPLTTVEGGGGLTARRDLTYNFSSWTPGWRSVEDMAADLVAYGDGSWTLEEALEHYRELWPEGGYQVYSNDLLVDDAYTLTNSTGEDKTVTLLYPFVGTLYEIGHDSPVLTLNGAKLDTELRVGHYSAVGSGRAGGLPSMTRPESWERYRDLLSDGRYQAGAVEDWPDLSSIPVTVYEITNPWVAEDSTASVPHIHAGFGLDYSKTTVLNYGFHGGSYDREKGTMRQSFDVPRPPAPDSSIDPAIYERERAATHCIIVVGEPVTDFRLFGTADGDPASTNYMEWGVEVGADLRQYETDLESALRTVAELDYQGTRWEDTFGNVRRPDFEMYFGLMKDCLLDTGVLSGDLENSYDLHWVEEMHFPSIKRVFYLKAQVVIPAGESVTVEASFLKAASMDYACTHTENAGVCGYDLVTQLGSNLDFTAQTARAVNTEGVEIVRQNFGFDWENGVDTVTLDPAEEHYYLEVRRTEKK